MKILIVQDCIKERLDVFKCIFRQKSVSVDVWVRGQHEFAKSATAYDLIFIMGSNASVLYPDRHEWIQKEQILIQSIIKNKVACVGICFGAQHLAKTLGAEIGSYTHTQISVDEIKVVKPGGVFENIEQYKALFFHQDYISWNGYKDIHGYTKDGHVEAFTANGHIWGFQSHIEVVSESLFLSYCKSHKISAEKKEKISSQIISCEDSMAKTSKSLMKNIFGRVSH